MRQQPWLSAYRKHATGAAGEGRQAGYIEHLRKLKCAYALAPPAWSTTVVLHVHNRARYGASMPDSVRVCAWLGAHVVGYR
jgi:hypothetical protein